MTSSSKNVNGTARGNSTVNGTANGHQNVEVNDETNGWVPDFRSAMILQLRQNGGLNRIQATLRQRLDEAGWSEALRDYIRHLFRSGEATTYEDALAIINKRIIYEGDPEPEDTPGTVAAPDLTISADIVNGGAEVVKKEMRKVTSPNK